MRVVRALGGEGLDVLIVKLPALLLILIIILAIEELDCSLSPNLLLLGLSSLIPSDRDMMPRVCSSSRQDDDVRFQDDLL